jgi:uncharacterized protein YndB with AHSA1/START domain
MKPGSERQSRSPPTRPAARAPERRDNARDLVSVRPMAKGTGRSMAERRASIRITRRFPAAPERVFEAWLDPGHAGQWLFATASRPMARVEIDARVGGSFRFVERRDGQDTEHTGRYLEIVPHRRLVFALAVEGRPQLITRVAVEVAPLRKGCALTLTHQQVPLEDVDRIEGRWIGILYGLGVTLDSTPTVSYDNQE